MKDSRGYTGLLAASDCFNFQPGSRNLPFKLADAGFEVWMGNARGTTYSQEHRYLNSTTDIAYWNFSWHEMGMYDVPAVTDTIIKESKNPKIFYIGHSMGTTQFFVSLAEIPSMNDKILAGFMLAPIAYLGHCWNILRLTFPFINTDFLYQIVNVALMGHVESAQKFRTKFKISPGDICDLTATKCGVCDNLYYMLYGFNAPQMNNSELSNLLAKFPNTISLKSAAHYAQIASTCTFRKYDFGLIENLKKYKCATPPDYKLENIRAPLYFYYGEGDNLGPPNDVNITASKFKPGVVKAVVKINENLFQHADFVTAKNADKLVYNLLLKVMKSILRQLKKSG